MKRNLIVFFAVVAALASCEQADPEDNTLKDQAFKTIAENFINNTLAPTYSALAAESDKLVVELQNLEADRTQANLETVCATFLEARKQWEMSEAFLFGAATVCGIDPHIDSWPLDEDGYKSLMASPSMLSNLKGEGGAAWAGDNLGNGLLGFHGMEYILFSDGKAKDVKSIGDDQYTYLLAVAGDLRNHTVQLEVAWLGKNAPKAHQDLMKELEYEVTCDGSGFSYSENLLNAGQGGSSLPSWTGALQYIIDGSVTIADEVGASKIGKPYNPTESGDERYIESPYSWNSITDFYDNITSIANVYFGGVEGKRNEATSLHNWMKKNHPEEDSVLCAAIENALKQIGLGSKDDGEGMVYPFVKNIKNKATLEAIEACNKLVEALDAVKEVVKH